MADTLHQDRSHVRRPSRDKEIQEPSPELNVYIREAIRKDMGEVIISCKYDPRLDKRASKWKSGTKEIIHVTSICVHTCLQGAGRGPATRVLRLLRVSDSAKHSCAEHL